MKRALCPLLIIVVIAVSSIDIASADDETYGDPTVTVVVPTTITPNMDIVVKVTINNTTGTRMWRTKVYLDTDSIPSSIRQYLVFYDTVDYPTQYLVSQGLKDAIEPDNEVNVNFRIKATGDIPAVTIPIYVVLESEIGICEDGCVPYRRALQYDIEVLRDEPYVFLEIDLEEVRLNVGECYIAKGNFNVGYTLTNTSQTTAFNVDLSVGDTQIPLSATITPQMPLTSIKPDNSKEGIVYMATGNLSPGTYTISLNLTFEDYYGKEFQTSESFNIIVVSDAYQLYEQGELYLLSCSYQNAISSFEEAKALYDEVGYQELSNKCYNKIELVNAIILFEQGQDYYFSGDLENAVAAYEAAKTHYDNADDCTGVSLCQDAINAIGQMDSTSPGDTEQTGGGGLTMLNMSLIIIIIVLVGMLVIVRMGKR